MTIPAERMTIPAAELMTIPAERMTIPAADAERSSRSHSSISYQCRSTRHQCRSSHASSTSRQQQCSSQLQPSGSCHCDMPQLGSRLQLSFR